MNINYSLLTVVIVLTLSLVVFLIWKNQKDKIEFEAEVLESESPPENDSKEILKN